DALPTTDPDDSTGLRIDVSLENEDTGETKWIDVTVVHTGSESYQAKELKAVSSRQITASISSSLAVPDPFQFDPSPLLIVFAEIPEPNPQTCIHPLVSLPSQ